MDNQNADASSDARPLSAPPSFPAVDEVQRVDAERENEPQYRYGHATHREFHLGGGTVHQFSFGARAPGGAGIKPPLLATWLCLGIAWLFLGSRVPFTVFLGIPFNLAALILAASSLSRGGVFTGVFVLLLGTAGSLLVYIIGLFRFLAHIL